jgi:glycerol kinase
MVGLTRGTTRAHIARAALEGIAYQVADVLDAMKLDSSIEIQEMRVDGGAAANNLLMQFQADLLQAPVIRPQVIETTALGAAYLAGLAANFWSSEAAIQNVWQAERVFEPQMSLDELSHRRARWREAVSRSREWEIH